MGNIKFKDEVSKNTLKKRQEWARKLDTKGSMGSFYSFSPIGEALKGSILDESSITRIMSKLENNNILGFISAFKDSYFIYKTYKNIFIKNNLDLGDIKEEDLHSAIKNLEYTQRIKFNRVVDAINRERNKQLLKNISVYYNVVKVKGSYENQERKMMYGNDVNADLYTDKEESFIVFASYTKDNYEEVRKKFIEFLDKMMSRYKQESYLIIYSKNDMEFRYANGDVEKQTHLSLGKDSTFKSLIGGRPLVISEAKYDYRPHFIKSETMFKKLNSDIDVNTLEENINNYLEGINDTLNSDLWNFNNELKPEVKEKILDVVDYFVDMLKEDEVDLVINDVVILGSNANYNYNEDSDIDVHIIANTEETKCPDLEYKLLQAYKTMFNYKHDIEIKGHEIELYVEENEVHAKSNGIYSLYEDKWLKVPKKEQVLDVDINDELNKWLTRFFDAEDNPTLDNINDFLDDIYKLRQTSIEQDGEYGVGNLVFKKLRGFGFIDELKNLLVKLEDKEMSLEGLNEDKEDTISDEDVYKAIKDIDEDDLIDVPNGDLSVLLKD